MHSKFYKALFSGKIYMQNDRGRFMFEGGEWKQTSLRKGWDQSTFSELTPQEAVSSIFPGVQHLFSKGI